MVEFLTRSVSVLRGFLSLGGSIGQGHPVLVHLENVNEEPLQQGPSDDQKAQESRGQWDEGNQEGVSEQPDRPDIDGPILLLPLVLVEDEDDQHHQPHHVGGDDVVGEGVQTVADERAEPGMEGFYHHQHHDQPQQEESILPHELPVD